jgi:thiol-disulfide isomerase/thioredoxin
MTALIFALSMTAAAPDPGRAPEFPVGLPWLNTSRPLSLAELGGKVVLLDFWTYCCVNCMQIIPDLKYFEQTYGDKGLVVIGVHSGKFDNEKDPENIRAAMRRYEITHPVVNDADYEIWESFGVQAWPTLVVIGADGKTVGAVAGEGHRATIEQAIQRAITDGERLKILKPGPVPGLALEKAPTSTLAFPGKLIVDGDRLFVSDTNHDRVIEAKLDGSVVATFGEGTLKHPQGLAVKGETIYVADTENHVVRAFDRKSKRMSVLAGTGALGRARKSEEGTALGVPTRVPLASPWDVLVVGNTLYIANAGTHQIFALDLAKKLLTLAAGSSREGLKDGDAPSAQLAQPSGLTSDGHAVFFADSEVSSIRRYDPKAQKVETLIGSGLFDFGDIDGETKTARLQHPLGLVFSGGALFIADSYNHKIKRLDLAKKRIETVFGKERGNGKDSLFEPGDVAVSGDALFIADTNNSRIVRYDIKTKAATELVLRF